LRLEGVEDVLLADYISMSYLLFAVLGRIVLLGFWGTIVGVSAATSLGDFTFFNGQILTPGLAIVDSPQPFTPEGGGWYFISLPNQHTTQKSISRQ